MTRRTLTALLGAALLVVLAGAGPAQATGTGESASGTFTIAGRGFGHGHGMSQYGANGAAKQGLSAAQILAFYYPGTALAVTSGSLRVLVTDATKPATIVHAGGRLKVKDLGRGGKAKRLPAKHGARWWRLKPVGARTVVQYKTKKWHTYKLRHKKYLVGDGEFRSPSGITLKLPGGATRVYRGAIRSATPTPGSGARGTVNVVAIDDYVRGVVPAEMPSSWSPAALQAQAIAARSYAMWSAASAPNRWYQICDTTACQVYRGTGSEAAPSNAAVAATAGKILTYGGQPAFTQFSASNGGYESAGSMPYLVAQSDPYDNYPPWSTPASVATAQAAYPQLGSVTGINITSRDVGGRATSVDLVGATTVTITGDAFRSLYGLKSSLFSFQ
ncbi:MAG: hypothetical protein JWO46_1976 [Nocardioidaceae bacterium]|nr:hypothetical protein [Nocardioidaceae bacterium]